MVISLILFPLIVVGVDGVKDNGEHEVVQVKAKQVYHKGGFD